MTFRMTERRKRVLQIRDTALALLTNYGQTMDMGQVKPLGLITGPLSILHNTPFNQMPLSRDVVYQGFMTEAEYKKELRAYHLNIFNGGKVMNIKWYGDEFPHIIFFKRGDWEDELLTIYECIKSEETKHENKKG